MPVLVDIELELVPLHDCADHGELFLRSVNERKRDHEVHLLGARSAGVDRPLEPCSDDLAEYLERRRKPHAAYKGRPGPGLLRSGASAPSLARSSPRYAARVTPAEEALVRAYVACQLAIESIQDLPSETADAVEQPIREFCSQLKPFIRHLLDNTEAST